MLLRVPTRFPRRAASGECLRRRLFQRDRFGAPSTTDCGADSILKIYPSPPYAQMSLQTPAMFSWPLLPSCASRETWGGDEQILDFSGGPYRILGLSFEQRKAIRQRLPGFCLESIGCREPVVEFCVYRAAADHGAGNLTLSESNIIKCSHGTDRLLLTARGFTAYLEFQPKFALSVWTRRDREFVVCDDFENLLRILVAYRLLTIGGVMLHSSAVVIDGGINVFVGRSGAGKSTVAQWALERLFLVLSDDINLLTAETNDVLVARSPFKCMVEEACVPNETYPLRGVYLLEKGACNAVRSTSTAEAVSALVTQSPFTNHDRYRVDDVINNLIEIVRAVPVRVLTFNRGGDFWGLLQ